MSEEIDLELTAVWEALEVGQRIIEEEENKKREEKEISQKALEEAKQLLFAWLPDAIQPYSKLLDLEVIESLNEIHPDFGWFEVKVPDLALITAYVKRGTPPQITYWVHDPTVVGDRVMLDDDWVTTVVYGRLKDYHIALARAYQVMENYVQRQHGSIPEPKVAEPEYVAFEQDMIESNGQFDTPLAAFYSTQMLNELVKLINYQIIQHRESQVNK